MSISPLNSKISRIGFHYFPDTMHYGEKDLQIWLPELHRLGASWITLVAPSERAIPEFFLKRLLENNIEPILHFDIPICEQVDTGSLQLLLENYSRWGVRYVAFYDRPNKRSSWLSSEWVKPELVERFIDLFLPLARIALNLGLKPIFPPLEPGGDYWDTSFLKNALASIERRGQDTLLKNLVLGVNAYSGNRPIDWGSGGPERWPGARPYDNSPGVQDQIGFRLYEWYAAVSKDVLGKTLPMILIRAGCQLGNQIDLSWPPVDELTHAKRNLEIANFLADEQNGDTGSEKLPQEVLACNFWLLAAERTSEYHNQSWYRPDGNKLIIVDQFRRWVASTLQINDELGHVESLVSGHNGKNFLKNSIKDGNGQFAINHYLLLPIYSWGMADWDIELIQPFIEKFHPTIGFSLAEARFASRVTFVGNSHAMSDEALKMLSDAGCKVDHLKLDGTLCAS